MTDDDIFEIINRLRSFADAYPEDVFTPLTPAETKAYSSIVTRASGGMGRHFSKFATEAADALTNQSAEIARLTKDAERYGWVRERFTHFHNNQYPGFNFRFELLLKPDAGVPTIDAAIDAALDSK